MTLFALAASILLGGVIGSVVILGLIIYTMTPRK